MSVLNFFKKIESNKYKKVVSKFFVCYDTPILNLPFGKFNILFELDEDDIIYLENKYKNKLEEERDDIIKKIRYKYENFEYED